MPWSGLGEPDVEYGFGVVNLGRHLPGPGSGISFNISIADGVEIEDGTHLVANVSVTSSNVELRVTISFNDIATGSDGYLPLAGELSLIVESPSGLIFRGNDHEGETEEHFSANQRVVVFRSIEIGIWKVHVIANLIPGILDRVKFAAVVRGSLSSDHLNFVRTFSCVGCEGTCDGTTGLCDCGKGQLGQSCQIAIEEIEIGTERTVTALPSGNVYLSFVQPSSNISGNVTVIINVTDEYSIYYYPFLHLYLREGAPPSAFPRDYEWLAWGLWGFSHVFQSDGQTSNLGAILIHHPLWWDATYRVKAIWSAPVSPSPASKQSSMALVIGLSVGALVLLVLIVVVVFVKYCPRQPRLPLDDGSMTQQLTETGTDRLM
jgi:hypothetical protein